MFSQLGYLQLVTVNGTAYPGWQAMFAAWQVDASTNQVTVQGYATAAQGYATAASASATAAATSATSATTSAATQGTSTTSLTIGTGITSLTIQTGKGILVGMQMRIADSTGGANYMDGVVTAYNSGTGSLTINVASAVGSGTLASWNVFMEGATGIAGSFPCVAAGGSADAITATYAPAITLTDKTIVSFTATAANATTTPTFSPNGLTAYTITKRGGLALVPGDIAGAAAVMIVEYNSANTRWELLNPIGSNFITPTGVNSTSSATSITFTASSVQIQNVTFTAAGQAIILPAANTMPNVGLSHLIRNAGTNNFDIQDSTGQLHLRRPPAKQVRNRLAPR